MKYYDIIIKNITETMQDDSILIVMSDHGTGIGNTRFTNGKYIKKIF